MIVKLLFVIAYFVGCRSLHLKQVVVLSRHNIRTPLTTNLELLTPKKWPTWNGDTGFLTPKGKVLERAMGQYFAEWMSNEGLLSNKCPENQVTVFSNTRHRTVQTAKAFAEGAFGDCNHVQVFYRNMTGMDPIFNPIVRNNTKEFKATVLKDMQAKLAEVDLREPFLKLNEIADLKNSEYCKTENICDLSQTKSDIVFEFDEEPDVSGAMKLGNTLVDAFLMAYYDGMSDENVAWGQLKTTEDWGSLLKILNTYHHLRFQTKLLDADVSSTLHDYLTGVFWNGPMKLYFLVGHDANILSLMSALRFKEYNLPGQFEKTPIGGKVVFQKWYDEEHGQELLRVHYVYQSMEQIRDGVEASLQNPPHWALLEMENCAVDERGFCPFSDFLKMLISE